MQPLDEHNRILINNVHPSDWQNPEPAGCYDLVVLGAGTAGLVTAAGAAVLGAKVALVERNLMGGDCLNVGCVPSKGIIRAARAAYDVRTAEQFGINAGKDLSVDFGRAMERMRRIRAGISAHDSVHRFSRELGVDVFLGEGRFAGPDSVSVGGKLLRFKKAAICTGARSAVPAVPGIGEAGCLTNETVFQLTELPKRLIVIGGGPLGCELAQAFARMGSRVTLLHAQARLLPKDDADAAEIVRRAFERDGVSLRLGSKIIRAAKQGSEKVITVEENGGSVDLLCDEILAAAGRVPVVEGLDLGKAGVAYDSRDGVKVDDRLRTSNRRIYAAGDVCSEYKFTHAADATARIVIANALFMGRRKASALVVPWCTFTDPEVAHVGMSGQEIAEKSIDTQSLTVLLSDVDRAVLDGETEGFARIHLKKGGDKILGATIVARHAGEMIGELSLAMTAGLGLSAIGRTVHPYPTQADAIRKLADAYNRSRFTPFLKNAVAAWLGMRRR